MLNEFLKNIGRTTGKTYSKEEFASIIKEAIQNDLDQMGRSIQDAVITKLSAPIELEPAITNILPASDPVIPLVVTESQTFDSAAPEVAEEPAPMEMSEPPVKSESAHPRSSRRRI